MSEILSSFVIEPIQAIFTVEPTNLVVTPDAIQLSIYTGSAPVAGGSNTNVQFNEVGVLAGSNSFTFNNVSEIVTIGNLAISNVANLGGTSNVKIGGGTNGYVLQTDGTGNLSWTAQAGNVTGNGTPGGSNTQIQYNNSGNFGGSAGFTFDSVSNVMNVPGNLIAAGNVTAPYFVGNATTANFASYAGYVVNSNQSNIQAVGTLGNLTVAGTIAGNIINTTGDITSNTNITANGNFIGNLSGTANTAVTVTGNVQSNITQVGTLTGLQVTGNINALTGIVYANVISANTITGNITVTDLAISGNLVAGKVTSNSTVQGTQLISNIATGTPPIVVTSTTLVPNLYVANANYAFYANVANNVTSTVANANYALYAGTVLTNAQPNITSVGTLSDLSIGNNLTVSNIATISNLRTTAANVRIGSNAGNTSQGARGIAIGENAGWNTQGVDAIAIGGGTATSSQNSNAIAIGATAAVTSQGRSAIAIGYGAGFTSQGNNAIAIGTGAGQANSQGINSIAIGIASGQDNQDEDSIAIGRQAGANSQGTTAIAIGAFAGYPIQSNNSIVLNASGANLNSAGASTFVVKPIQSTANNNILMYNTTSGEITYSTLSSYTGYLKSISTTVGALTAAATAGDGARAFVTDANLIASGNFGAIVGSGGANKAPVYSDGTDWRIG